MPFCEHTLLNGLSFNICFDKIFISQDFWNELELALFGIIDLLIKKMFNLYSSLFTILWHKTWRKPQLVINGKIVIHSCLTNQFSGKNCTGCLKKHWNSVFLKFSNFCIDGDIAKFVHSNWVFSTNTNFRILISLQPDDLNLWYFKLRLF